MQKFISSIRNKKLKGNVSLLVILILLASSVIALLSISQIQHLITYWDMTFNYFRAFYLAKAWTELGLTEVYNSGDWFKHNIDWIIPKKDDDSELSELMQINFAWEDNKYIWAKPYFTMDIESNFKTLTNDIRNSDSCNDDNKIKLKPGDGIMLSLFSDNTKDFDKILSDETSKKTFTPQHNIWKLSLDGWDHNSELTLALFTYNQNSNWEEYMEDIVVQKDWDLQPFLARPDTKNLINKTMTKKYITIKNSWPVSTSFCIKKDNELIPYSNALITVRGHYADMEVWLQSVVKKDVPYWSLNVLGEESASE